ncbi:MAG: cupin domain-containing protein [Clostridiales bacterium]|jgi:mannose-6-phosphate isomerase-like protein (cupin superfamily)|nr:cupin domain-containing protein [Clostridiales bacterium]OPZ70223.1 MAG: Cupin domain protein [Firmicutes bacterium ADurb.Bin467]
MRRIHERDVPEAAVPGRFLRWIVGTPEGLPSDFCSCCIMRVEPGKTVSPAHSHPMGEELIYFLEGEGKVYVDGEIRGVRAGSAVLFEKGSIHMVRNSGDREMKVACFFAPPSRLKQYEFHPEVCFDDGVERE